MLKFNILTLFPEVFPGILQHGLLGKALSKNHFEINTINIRDYSDLSDGDKDWLRANCVAVLNDRP